MPPAIPPAIKDDAPEICFISSTRSSLARARFDASYELYQINLTKRLYPNLIALSGKTLRTFKPFPVLSDVI
jgi:hypothetical protein